MLAVWPIILSSALASAPAGNQDFVRLQSSLKQFIQSHGDGPTRNIPLLVRASFHDLAALDGANGLGPQGCLLNKQIQDIKENAGLNPIMQQLSAFVATSFPSTSFAFGDVVSLAGKVAVETAYPCMQIKWSFGRKSCSITGAPGAIPAGNITHLSELQPFLKRYGLSAEEMAILIAGAHGINGAKATTQNSGFGTQIFAGKNSGQNWIDLTFKLPWLATPSGFFANDPFPLSPPIMRLPIDMLFFPTVSRKNDGVVDTQSQPVETFLQSFTKQDRSVFDQEFAKVYAKMLEIGTDRLNAFVETPNTVTACKDN